MFLQINDIYGINLNTAIDMTRNEPGQSHSNKYNLAFSLPGVEYPVIKEFNTEEDCDEAFRQLLASAGNSKGFSLSGVLEKLEPKKPKKKNDEGSTADLSVETSLKISTDFDWAKTFRRWPPPVCMIQKSGTYTMMIKDAGVKYSDENPIPTFQENLWTGMSQVDLLYYASEAVYGAGVQGHRHESFKYITDDAEWEHIEVDPQEMTVTFHIGAS